jgi:hypothetical protein
MTQNYSSKVFGLPLLADVKLHPDQADASFQTIIYIHAKEVQQEE